MPDAIADHRKYLDPRTLAKISSLDLRARLIVEGLTAGQHRSPFQGISVEFAQHRAYVQGDDVRHVDWKVLGKTDKVYLKQYLQETNLQLICVVDASESMGYGTVTEGSEVGGQRSDRKGIVSDLTSNLSAPTPIWTKYDHATAMAAGLAYLAIQQQDAVGLAVFDQNLSRYLKPSNSPGQWKQITRELQQVPRLNKTGTGRVLEQLAEKLHHRSVIVILSDLFDDLDALQQGMRRLRYRKHELIVFQVLDPTEITFPFNDVTLFEGMEGGGNLLTEPRSLRAAYLKQLRDHTDGLRKICRGMRVDFARVDTGERLDVALSGYLATRSASIK